MKIDLQEVVIEQLEAALSVLNAIPNTYVPHNGYYDSYELAAAIEVVLEEIKSEELT